MRCANIHYHGTNKDFDLSLFRTQSRSFNTVLFGIPNEVERHGIFLSDSKDFAKEYGKNVIPLSVDVKKTADVEKERWEFVESLDAFSPEQRDVWMWAKFMPDNCPWSMFDNELGKMFVDFLTSKGYDSARFKEVLPAEATSSKKEIKAETLVVFDVRRIEDARGCPRV